MSKVFIIQEPMKWDDIKKEYLPFMDFRNAAEYGNLEVLIEPGLTVFSPGPMVKMIKERLKDIKPEDYLICVGDPAVIGIAVSIASIFNQGRVNLLKYNRKSKTYIKVEVNLDIVDFNWERK